jgi:hypothetical protein
MGYLLIDKIDQVMLENGFIASFIYTGVPPKGATLPLKASYYHLLVAPFHTAPPKG